MIDLVLRPLRISGQDDFLEQLDKMQALVHQDDESYVTLLGMTQMFAGDLQASREAAVTFPSGP